MSDSTFVSMAGVVQQFTDRETKEPLPVVSERETSAGTIREFTIRTTGNQALVRISVFPEYASAIANLSAGDGVYADGAYGERTHNGTLYRNLNARTLAITPVAPRAEQASSSRPTRAAKAF